LLGEAFFICMEYPGADCLLLRRDFPELEKGLILDFKNTVPKELYRYNDAKHIATFHNDSHIFFGHLTNGSERTLSQYLSAAFVWIGIDELGQFSFEAYSFLSSRNRINKGCQKNSEGYYPIPRMGGATNPLGPGYGWIKQTWIENKPVVQLGETHKGRDGRWYSMEHGREVCVLDPADYTYVHSTVLDNPAQIEKDPGYIEKLMKLAPPLRQKALYGDLDSVAGSYFTNFTYERNVRALPKDREEMVFEDWQPVWIGFDWGLAHHTAVFWFTRAKVLGIDGNWRSCVVTLRELLVNEMDYQNERSRGMLADDWNYKQWLCHKILDHTPAWKEGCGFAKGSYQDERAHLKYIFLSPERFKRIDETSHTVAGELTQIMKSLGLPHCSEANDAREDGAVMMYNLTDSGEWIILANCEVLIRAIQTRVRDEKKREDVLKTEDILDDAYDGCRYGLLSMLKERGKPEDVKLAEKIASIPDPTARMIYAFEHRNDKEKRSQPIKHKIVPGWMKRR
jgi:hypothetical protein